MAKRTITIPDALAEKWDHLSIQKEVIEQILCDWKNNLKPHMRMFAVCSNDDHLSVDLNHLTSTYRWSPVVQAFH